MEQATPFAQPSHDICSTANAIGGKGKRKLQEKELTNSNFEEGEFSFSYYAKLLPSFVFMFYEKKWPSHANIVVFVETFVLIWEKNWLFTFPSFWCFTFSKVQLVFRLVLILWTHSRCNCFHKNLICTAGCFQNIVTRLSVTRKFNFSRTWACPQWHTFFWAWNENRFDLGPWYFMGFCSECPLRKARKEILSNSRNLPFFAKFKSKGIVFWEVAQPELVIKKLSPNFNLLAKKFRTREMLFRDFTQ